MKEDVIGTSSTKKRDAEEGTKQTWDKELSLNVSKLSYVEKKIIYLEREQEGLKI